MPEKDVDNQIKEIDDMEKESKKKKKSGGLFSKLKRKGKKKEKDVEQNIFMGDDSPDQKDGENIDYDENVITADEFKAIEKDEKTEAPQIIEKEDEGGGKKEVELSPIEELVMKTERIEGRIVAMD